MIHLICFISLISLHVIGLFKEEFGALMIACMLFVMSWIPEGSFKIPEVSTLPLWVNLENIHDCFTPD